MAVLVVAVLMCSLGGCSDSESGWLEGRAFTMNAYSNTGELTLTSHAEKIGWTADRPNMRLIMDVLQDDDGTASVPLPLTSDYLLVDSGECDDRCQYGWLSVLEQLPEHVDYGRLDETGMRVMDWLNGMADPSPEIFEDWEAISLIRQNVYEDEPTGLADLLRSATRTERDECFDMLEQVETGRSL